ncbi:hypothetical protein PoB_006574000 [Plakobranchus ocellatus]|uniref:Uncharacterized protein n=1 Tax=Plakobranchus ocellatus TaxID=259542 RepID=A0AAV4D511_9GAST|nr:hypothetical protein PoB_006574000 [Plakobranchus ocellatus]
METSKGTAADIKGISPSRARGTLILISQVWGLPSCRASRLYSIGRSQDRLVSFLLILTGVTCGRSRPWLRWRSDRKQELMGSNPLSFMTPT